MYPMITINYLSLSNFRFPKVLVSMIPRLNFSHSIYQFVCSSLSFWIQVSQKFIDFIKLVVPLLVFWIPLLLFNIICVQESIYFIFVQTKSNKRIFLCSDRLIVGIKSNFWVFNEILNFLKFILVNSVINRLLLLFLLL